MTVKIPLAVKGIRSGMFGRAAIATGTGREGLFVPAAAVQERGALTSLWVVDGNKVARLRLVKTGKKVGARVEILAGLSAGERIVASGADKVSEGAKVEQ
jgi:multidrug efflux pump subunit AcrA (membrane-fusion protein)